MPFKYALTSTEATGLIFTLQYNEFCLNFLETLFLRTKLKFMTEKSDLMMIN